jgi:hypothetical protein
MKLTFTLKQLKQKIFLLFLLFAAGSFISCSVVEALPDSDYKNRNSKHKEKSVKIYPDWLKRIIHIKSIEKNTLDLFVFEIDGTLVRHFKMYEGDHKKLSDLDHGAYVYQVFKGDEMSESGKINIK